MCLIKYLSIYCPDGGWDEKIRRYYEKTETNIVYIAHSDSGGGGLQCPWRG